MSIELDSPGTEPSPVHVTWMHGVPRKVDVSHGACGFHLSIEDVLLLCSYVLTNSDLDPDDERLKFVEAVKRMQVVDGWNKGGKRLQHPETRTYFYRRPDAGGHDWHKEGALTGQGWRCSRCGKRVVATPGQVPDEKIAEHLAVFGPCDPAANGGGP